MSEQEAWLKGIDSDEKDTSMTQERFMEIFEKNIEILYEIHLKIKGLEDYRLVVLHMMAEMELKERGIIK